jgi:hypothetical protein
VTPAILDRPFTSPSPGRGPVGFGRRQEEESGPTFYVSPTGSDAADGLSPATAWQTIAKVNAGPFDPGDRILFEGGATFTENLLPTYSGTPADPIYFGSYGTGKAIIDPAADEECITIWNHDGFIIEDIICQGPGGITETQPLVLYNDSLTTKLANGMVIRRCEAYGGKFGMVCGGDVHGFSHVLFEDCIANNNIHAGIASFGPDVNKPSSNWANTDITLRRCSADSNPGNPAAVVNTGSGMVLGSVNGGVIEFCTAFNNGEDSDASEGPVGIWAFNSNNVTIRKCISANNTSILADGGGYDLDQGSTNCIIEHCLAYNNDGPGYLCYGGGGGAYNWRGNIIRYNIGWGNSKRLSSFADILVGGVTDGILDIYGNTMIARANGAVTPRCIGFGTHGGVSIGGQIRVRNNVFRQVGAAPAADAASAYAITSVLMQNNAYDRVDAGTIIEWGAGAYSDLASWRAVVASQEQIAGVNSGFVGDVHLVAAWDTPTEMDPSVDRIIETLRPATGSPILGLAEDFGYAVVTDYEGQIATALGASSIEGGDEIPAPVAETYIDLILSTPGVEHYWPLNDGSGTQADDLVGTSHGTYVGTPTLSASGIPGGDGDPCPVFNGTTQYVLLPDGDIFGLANSAFTLECWVLPNGSAASSVVAVGAGHSVNTNPVTILATNTVNSSQFRCNFRNDAAGGADVASGAVNMKDGNWHHTVITSDGSNVRLFIDGIERASRAHSGGTYTFTRNRIAALQRTTLTSFYWGRIAQVASYDRALGPAEVLEHYEAGVTP